MGKLEITICDFKFRWEPLEDRLRQGLKRGFFQFGHDFTAARLDDGLPTAQPDVHQASLDVQEPGL